MTRCQWKMPVLAIADDFTGANDAGSGLARAGARVNVLFDVMAQVNKDADVWVISTDSRACSADVAAARTRMAVERWGDHAREGWIFKKMDSTLRGNPGAETQAALLACGACAALVVPAVPKLGRTTRGGQCYIHHRLLTETEYASDPKTPVSNANVLARLQEQSTLQGGLLPLAVVRQPELAARMAAAIEEGQRLIVVDAETDDDLQRIMRAAAELPARPLLAGASGLSDALSDLLTAGETAREPLSMPLHPQPALLAVVGSMSETAQQQISRLQQCYPLQLIEVNVQQIFHDAGADVVWRQQAIAALLQGQHCVIRTCQQPSQRQEIDALCARYGLIRQQLGERICAFLAGLTRDVLSDVQPAGLYLSGGDVAIAVAQALCAEGFRIMGQVAGCVPWGQLLQSKNDLLVFTKAGGFGDENTLVDVFRFIEEKAGE